ncbi:MAG: hypothetical protein H0U73_10315 [Tatlockia sp.]|nr:hypothetical protein [Tatlockia sp.]
MKIYSKQNKGIIEIFLYDIEDLTIKPNLTLILPNNEDNDKYLNEYLPDLKSLGCVEVTSKFIQVLTITSQRKVALALKIIRSSPEHNLLENEVLFEKFKVVEDHLAVLINEKSAAPPPKSKNFANYHLIEEDLRREPGTTPPRHKVVKVQKENDAKVEIFKIVGSGRRITEIEAFNALCFRLLLNDRTPMVRSVHDKDGNRKGVLSTEIDNFQSLHDYYLKQQAQTGVMASPPQKDLVKSGIGRILGAGYSEEENDLSGANIGYDPINLKTYKIDHGQATFPFTSKYVGKDPNKRQQSSGRGHGVKPTDIFPITQRDINVFPHLIDAKPLNFPDLCDAKLLDLIGIENDPEFIADVFIVFVKRVLVSELIYRNIAAMTISCPSLQEKLVAHKTKRGALLKEELLKNEKFCKFIHENPNLKEQVMNEFRDYNDDFNICSRLRINLAELNKNYDDFIEQIRSSNETKESLVSTEYSSSFFKNGLLNSDGIKETLSVVGTGLSV